MTGRPQRNSGALKPGLIILLGATAIALVLVAILLLPPPNIRSVARRLIPPDTTIVSELNYGDLIGMNGSTEASLIDVAEFYRKRFRLGRGRIVGGGISSWSQGGLFGGLRSGVTMPYTTEGFVILVRDKNEVAAVVASRTTSETATHIEIYCKRAPEPTMGLGQAISGSSFAPVDATAESSASSLLTAGAIFTSSAAFTNITTAYYASVLKARLAASTNCAVSPAGSGMVSIPKRAGAASATFVARTNVNQLVLIHCFRSLTSTQTHVMVGCASR